LDYEPSKKYLLDLFNTNHFVQNFQSRKLHSSQIIIQECSNGTRIGVSFPGYKTQIKPNQIVYDYRVDILKGSVTTALSHANIIVDIYNKMTSGGMSSKIFREVLIELSREGHFDVSELSKKLTYKSIKPSEELKERANKAHKGKIYNTIGNSFDLSIEELIIAMKWIVLQEDINYPIAKGYEGRKMPFARYIETTHIIEHTTYSLEQVIERALSHSRPSLWNEFDYSFRNFIS
jgi:hypothetical protein